jgi:hypothetical protein
MCHALDFAARFPIPRACVVGMHSDGGEQYVRWRSHLNGVPAVCGVLSDQDNPAYAGSNRAFKDSGEVFPEFDVLKMCV